MSKILIGIGVVFGLLVTVGGSYTYLERYALCANVNKQFEVMDQKQQQDKILFQFELKSLELKQINEQIYQIEKNYGIMPKDPIKRADLERLKRQREEIMIEQRLLKEKK